MPKKYSYFETGRLSLINNDYHLLINQNAQNKYYDISKGSKNVGTINNTLLPQKTLSDPKNPEYKEMCEWLGLTKKETWEGDNFDRRQTSKWLRRFSVEYLQL